MLRFTVPSPQTVNRLRCRASAAASQLLFPVVGKFPLRGHDLSFVLPLTGKPDASGTKTQIRP